MLKTMEATAVEVVAGWRRIDEVDGQNHPAGPLFPSGGYAEQELTMTVGSGRCGTACTYSAKFECC